MDSWKSVKGWSIKAERFDPCIDGCRLMLFLPLLRQIVESKFSPVFRRGVRKFDTSYASVCYLILAWRLLDDRALGWADTCRRLNYCWLAAVYRPVSYWLCPWWHASNTWALLPPVMGNPVSPFKRWQRSALIDHEDFWQILEIYFFDGGNLLQTADWYFS